MGKQKKEDIVPQKPEPAFYIERPEDIKNPIIPILTKHGALIRGEDYPYYPKGCLINVFGE